MKRTFRVLVLTFATVAASFGTTIFDNGTLNNLGASLMSDFLQAEDFSLVSPSNLTGVTFFSAEASGAYLGTIEWSIRANTAFPFQPGSVIASGTASSVTRVNLGTPAGLGGLAAFSNTFSVSVSLATDTYWLVLHNGPNSTLDSSEFYWATADSNLTILGKEQSLLPPSSTWDTNSQEHAFLISGNAVTDIPEPATIWTLSLGAAALWLTKQARNRG